MRRLRFFCQEISSECVLDEAEAHHLSKVLRGEEGMPVELFDGQGTIAEGKIGRIEKRRVIIRVTEVTRMEHRKTGRRILAVSYAKGQRFDWLVEKCTELGADHIAAVQFDRTVKLGSENAVERLKKIGLAAAKQCGRLFLPEITGPERFLQTMNRLRKIYPDAIVLCGDPDGKNIHALLSEIGKRDIIVLIGPEGGFSPEESDWIKSERIEPVSINPNILRVETAAAAFCAQLCSMP